MAYAHTDFVATAGQQNFVFDIPYLSRDNMFVFQNGTLLATPADWEFLLAQTVRLTVGASVDDIIRVKRVTPIDEPIVDYANGSVLGENELDATALQSLFAAQEVDDLLASAIQQNDFLQWDALTFPIINLGAPTAATDAATKQYVDDTIASTPGPTGATGNTGAQGESGAALLSGTSTTNWVIGLGAATLTTQAGKAFTAGTWLLLTSNILATNYMHGYVTSYAGTTLVVEVTNVGGSGNAVNDWGIRVSGTRGAVGATGSTGATGDTGAPGEVTEAELTTAISNHEAAANPHPTYMTSAEVDTSIAAHEGAADPHTGYQKESEKDAASGYAGLTAGSKLQTNAVVTLSITDANVTKAKMENADADSLIGRGNGGGAGVPEKITLGTNLSMTGTVLNATGGSGGDSLIYEFW